MRVELMNLAPRCLAKTRRATLCQSPAVRGKKRCRLHGGSKGSGGQKGNQNAFKHGKYTADYLAKRKATKEILRDARILLGRVR